MIQKTALIIISAIAALTLSITGSAGVMILSVFTIALIGAYLSLDWLLSK